MILQAFATAALTLSAAAIVAVALAILVIAHRDNTPYRVAGRFLLNPIAIRVLARREPELVADYATHGYYRWSDITALRERGWTPATLDTAPSVAKIPNGLVGRALIIREMTGEAFTAWTRARQCRGTRVGGLRCGKQLLPLPLKEMQAWYELLGNQAPAGHAAGLSLAEATAMDLTGTLDPATILAMAALRPDAPRFPFGACTDCA